MFLVLQIALGIVLAIIILGNLEAIALTVLAGAGLALVVGAGLAILAGIFWLWSDPQLREFLFLLIIYCACWLAVSAVARRAFCTSEVALFSLGLLGLCTFSFLLVTVLVTKGLSWDLMSWELLWWGLCPLLWAWWALNFFLLLKQRKMRISTENASSDHTHT